MQFDMPFLDMHSGGPLCFVC